MGPAAPACFMLNDDDEPWCRFVVSDTCNVSLVCCVLSVKVSEKPIDYKIWKALFNIEIPYKPTYLPNTKLARFLWLSTTSCCRAQSLSLSVDVEI